MEQKRIAYIDQLKDLKSILFKLEERTLKAFYTQIYVEEKNISKAKESLRPSKEEDALHTLKLLLSLYKQEDVRPKNLETRRTCVTSVLAWGLAILATPGRSALMGYAINEMLSAFIHSNFIVKILSYALGYGIASLAQGKIEKDALYDFFYRLSYGKKIPQITSHAPLRIFFRIWNGLIQGPLYTVPYLFTFFFASDIWWSPPSPHPYKYLALFIPAMFTDIVNNAETFNASSDEFIKYCAMLHSRRGNPGMGTQRDILIRKTRELRRMFKTLRPDVLAEVDKRLQAMKVEFVPPVPEVVEEVANEVGSGEEDELIHSTPLLRSRDDEPTDFALINPSGDPEGSGIIINNLPPKKGCGPSLWQRLKRCFSCCRQRKMRYE